jgi:hypothetical protein
MLLGVVVGSEEQEVLVYKPFGVFLCMTFVFQACSSPKWKKQPLWCHYQYQVAPGENGKSYEGLAEVYFVESLSVESIDSTHSASVFIYTLDEESNLRTYGIPEPALYVRFRGAWPSLFAQNMGMHICHTFISDPPEVIELNLDGSGNYFTCFSDPDSDAELVFHNVGDDASMVPEPKMTNAELVGFFSENNGAELYEIRLHSFVGRDWTYCDDTNTESYF